MDQQPQLPEQEKPSTTDKMVATLKWWNRLSTLNADDPFWLGVIKIGIRIIGILILLAISPFVILGLFIALTASL